ncbi:MAG: XRE family transcriptional regulator [Roseiarcus sp.]
MARTLDEVIRSLPLDQQQDIEARAARLIEEEMTLRDLSKAQELTQARVAEAHHISQDGVSRIEKRSDFLLSTLRSYVEAMGGSLRLVVEFPDRNPVTISGFDKIANQPKPSRSSLRTSNSSAPKRPPRSAVNS